MAEVTDVEASGRREESKPPVSVRVCRADVAAVPVMRVVISGAASRWDVPLDPLDDVQLAVETLVAEEPPEGCDFLLSLSVRNDDLWVRLDGLTNQGVKNALVFDRTDGRCEGCLLDVRLVLDSLVDVYQVREADPHTFAVEMAKRAW